MLAVEIITKESPEPGPPNQSEIDHRRNHIHQIEQDHPLLPIVLECLKDRDTERPSSPDLCHRLAPAALKKSPDYVKSSQKDSPTVSQWKQTQDNQELTQKLTEKRQQLAQANQELQEKSQQLVQANQELQEVTWLMH